LKKGVNQETQTRDENEKSKSDLKKKTTSDVEKENRLQPKRDGSPRVRREKSKIDRKKSENEQSQDKDVEHAAKQQQNALDNSSTMKGKRVKEEPSKEAKLHGIKENEPVKNEQKPAKKNDMRDNENQKDNNDRLKEPKSMKRDKDKKNIDNNAGDTTKETSSNPMKGNQKSKVAKKPADDDDENMDSGAETNNDVSFVLDNKTGTNSKESSSNSFTKMTPINKDATHLKTNKKEPTDKKSNENRERSEPVEKSFNEYKNKPKPSKDLASRDKSMENSNKKDLPMPSTNKRQHDDEDDDDLEPKSKINNNANFNKFKDNPSKEKNAGSDLKKTNTNKNTGFQANSKRDPTKEALTENSKNGMPYNQREPNKENTKPKKSDNIETQTVICLYLKYNQRLSYLD